MASSLAMARHVTDRLGYGPRPDDLDRIAAMGAERWIAQQLEPRSIPLPPDFTAALARFTTRGLDPLQRFVEYGPPSVRPPGGGKLTPEEIKERNRRFRFVAQEAIDVRLLRALASPCQLEECLADFWFNHFNVFLGKGLDRLWLGAYVEEAIRPHSFGRFRDLLGATAQHPAMLFFLDQWLDTAPGSPGARGPFNGLNENYAREVMELHTLGVNGGYTQADVIALARILTGWTIGPLQSRPVRRRPPGFGNFFRPRPAPRPAFGGRAAGRGTFVFDPDRHDFDDKLFLGHHFHGGGIEEGEAALDMLAKSPATAHHISFELAQYFLADTPDKEVTAAMARTFLATDGHIRAVLEVLFHSAAFRAPANFGAKFKTPYRYVVSALRAGDVPVRNFRPLEGILYRLGERPYGCLTPDGYKNTRDAWLNPDGMMQRLSFAAALASGHLPLEAEADETPLRFAGDGEKERPADRRNPALDATRLMAALGNQFSSRTHAAIEAAAPALRAAMVLGSPEFMRC